eukprot:TRINITY_DN102127_c0_g1_i1.p1 TRINITY_DN102127_c0_g1~~TRINITY_DN102127_c0_g1_i1.p1  ORF type:complete len:841 (-),score=166.57 TRINITY_DN102127_c0_g1_i1:9-2465(-)
MVNKNTRNQCSKGSRQRLHTASLLQRSLPQASTGSPLEAPWKPTGAASSSRVIHLAELLAETSQVSHDLFDHPNASRAHQMPSHGVAKSVLFADLDHRSHAGIAPPSAAGSNAAALEGVKANAHGDLVAFLSALGVNCGMVLFGILVISILRRQVPTMYQYRRRNFQRLKSQSVATTDTIITEKVDDQDSAVTRQSVFGWVVENYAKSFETIEMEAGLDHALHVMYLQVASRWCVLVGVPLVAILCPLHFFCGGDAAGDDRLSHVGFGNVEQGSWVCWVHAVLVWYVVIVTESLIHRSQKDFVPVRIQWLKEMPSPNATTILVQDIPDELKTRNALTKFFDVGVFGQKSVKQVDFVKNLDSLIHWKANVDDAKKQGQMDKLANAERQYSQLRAELHESEDINSSSAFVTFHNRREAAIAYKLLKEDDQDGIRADLPPDPSEVIWTSLQADKEMQPLKELGGYFAIFLLFWGFMPMVVFIQSVASLESLEKISFFKTIVTDLPAVAAMWDGLVASLALSTAMSMLPMFLMLIFSSCFVARAEVDRQHRLQVWYFNFLVIFVLLATAIGSSIISTGKELLEQPFSAPALLAKNMPASTHFYLKFIPLQMAAYITVGMRNGQLAKYLFFKSMYGCETAKELAEPEDQNFLGLGSRGARATLQLVTVITFCQLSPLISILGYMNFNVVRMVHTWLFTEVENRKPDSGGMFWVTQLYETQQGLFLFVLLMSGVLAQRAGNPGPGILAASSFVPLGWAYQSFKRRFRWQHLQVEDIIDDGMDQNKAKITMRTPTRSSYRQPELPEHDNEVQNAASGMRTKLRLC